MCLDNYFLCCLGREWDGRRVNPATSRHRLTATRSPESGEWRDGDRNTPTPTQGMDMKNGL